MWKIVYLCSLLANLVIDAADPVLPEFGKQLVNSGRTLSQNKHLAAEYKLVFMLEIEL